MRSNQNSLHSTLNANSVSVLTESAEVDMRERLEQLRDVPRAERTTLSELEKEVDQGLNELKTWAGNEENTPTASITSTFVETNVADSDEDISFAIIPSHVDGRVESGSPIESVQTEIVNIEKRNSSAASTMSFECIDSLQVSDEDDDSEVEIQNESVIEVTAHKRDDEAQSIQSDRSEEAIQDAAKRQAAAMKELVEQIKQEQMNTSSSMSSSCRILNRELSTNSSTVDPETQRERDEETQREIEQLAKDIENEQIIKLVANSGETPKNSRDYSENGIQLVENEMPGPSTIGMEDDSPFRAYNSFSEIPTYVPPLPTPLPSNMGNQTYGLQVDLDRDNRALDSALDPARPDTNSRELSPAPSAPADEVSRSVNFQPMNGIQMLRAEFGAEYDVLSAAALRKLEYDATRAAEFIRANDLCTQFLVAKLRLNDLDIDVNENSLAQLCVTYGNIGQVISDYIDAEFNQDRVVVHVDGVADQNAADPWSSMVNFVQRTARNVMGN